MEEMDLLYRARKKGFRTLFYPYSRFIHYGTGSSRTHRKQPVLNIYRGLVFFYSKHKNPLQRIILRFMLKSKAALAWFIGIIIGDDNFVQTYAEAYKLV
jgi:GT2 family glycosyltransferase